MTRARSNLTAHELVGLSAVVRESSDPTQRGLSGTIVDETRNMITIETSDREVHVQKRGTVLEVAIDGGVRLDCNELMFKPEDRTKRCMGQRRKKDGRKEAS